MKGSQTRGQERFADGPSSSEASSGADRRRAGEVQVGTPRRGRMNVCSTSQPTRIARKTQVSMLMRASGEAKGFAYTETFASSSRTRARMGSATSGGMRSVRRELQVASTLRRN
jgi:hypothetical protein